MPVDSEPSKQDRAARLSALWLPSDALSINLRHEQGEFEREGNIFDVYKHVDGQGNPWPDSYFTGLDDGRLNIGNGDPFKYQDSFLGNDMVSYKRADISVAVSTPSGLITPIIRDAANLSVSRISNDMKELAGRAKEGKLQPHEYQGGTASLSNMGMYGIKQFEAVINPPQGMILAIGAGEKRPFVVDDALAIATVMSATGSFDHRAIDGSDGAQLMQVFTLVRLYAAMQVVQITGEVQALQGEVQAAQADPVKYWVGEQAMQVLLPET